MSLRSYLFILIGCLITLLTVTQLVIVNWIENNLADEVDYQARHYSDQVIDLAVKSFDKNQAPSIIIKQSTAKEKAKVLNNNIELFTVKDKQALKELQKALANKPQEQNQTHVIEQEIESTALGRKIITREFKTLVENIHKEKAKILHNKDIQTLVVQSPNTIKHTWITNNRISPTSKALFQKIQITLITVGILGLIFAYWLSIKFNKPLKSLTNGFTLLAKGNYQHQVKEEGVKEIRETISHFNNMVERLAQLSQAEKQHKEIAHLAELGEVSRGLAHALRNPIHTIGLSIEQLSDNSLDHDYKETLIRTIQHKIENIDKSIKALLTLTTTGVRRDDNIPILAVVQDIVLEYKSSPSKTIDFDIDIQDDLKLIGAESEIRSILHTLINNACDASDENTTVTISAHPKQTCLEIIIKDHGRGLEPHIQQQLFEPHVSTKPEGAGMGLYIANRLITLHYEGNLSLNNILDEHQKITGCCAQANFNTLVIPTSSNGK